MMSETKNDMTSTVPRLVMRDDELCKWLRDNSSGVYRPSAEAANRIEALKSHLEFLRDLISEQDVNVFGSNGNGEIEWSLRDEVVDGLTKQINA